MKSLFGGSAVIAATILSSSFLLSARPSVAETLLSSLQKPTQELSQSISKQDPKPDVAVAGLSENLTTAADPATKVIPEAGAKTLTANDSAGAKIVIANPIVNTAANPTAATTTSSTPAAAAATYTATAYSLGGRTASGMRVTKGLIAADPRILPLGTRVLLDAGAYSGEYLVADTGGSVRGKKIDIWTPNSHEANRFGRRLVRLTVLSYPAKRVVAARHRRR